MQASSAPSAASGDTVSDPSATAATNPLVTNIHSFHQYVAFKQLDAGQFQRVPRWKKKAILGKIERHHWRPEGAEERSLVCVKIMENDLVDRSNHSEANDREAFGRGLSIDEDALTEIGVYTYLNDATHGDPCPYLLKMHGAFRGPGHTWLVMENCTADFFDIVEKQRDYGDLSENKIGDYMRMLLQAVNHLHKHNIGHCDISLENLLYKDGELRLMDFGQAVRLQANDGTPLRYFRLRGKNFYRAPECYAPQHLQVQVPFREENTPGQVTQVVGGEYMCNVRFPLNAVPGETAVADLWGYDAALMDVFACGVVLFILQTQVPPWRQAVCADLGFRYAWQHGAAALCQHFKRPFESASAAALLNGMLHGPSTGRFTLSQCMDSAFISPAPG